MKRWRAIWPGQVDRFWPCMAAWTDSLVVDLGLLRLPVNRPVELAPGIWRSNQPTPWRLKRLASQGFKAVVNLRGEGLSGSFHLEKYWCARLGMELRSLKLSSRRPPTHAQLAWLAECLDQAPKPLLLHCKSGADRAGLVAALAQMHSGVAVSQAKQQLSFKYLHIRQASTGILDYFLDCFESDQARRGKSFQTWVETDYDRDRMLREYKAVGLASWLTDGLLRRE